MKKQEILKIIDMVLPAVANGDIIPALTYFCFRDGTISSYNGWVAVSFKVATNFEGLVPAKSFSKVLVSLGEEKIDFSYSKGILSFTSEKKKKGKIKYKESVSDFPDLEIWKDFDWLKPPAGLLEAIYNVKFAVAIQDVNPVLRGVQIKDKWVVGADTFRISRSQLSTKVPFPMVIPKATAEVLSKMRARIKLLGICKHKSGVIFNFGDFRVFSQLIEGEIVVDKVASFFEGYSLKVDLPDELKGALERVKVVTEKMIKKEVEISIGNGIISCNSMSDHFGEIQEEYDAKLHRRLRPVCFITEPIYFGEIIARAARIAYKGKDNPIYFENDACQYLIQTIGRRG